MCKFMLVFVLILLKSACNDSKDEVSEPTAAEIAATQTLQDKVMRNLSNISKQQQANSEEYQVSELENQSETDRQSFVSESIDKNEKLNAEEAKAMLEVIGGIDMDDSMETQPSDTDDE